MDNFDALDRKQAVIAGMEAHVCAMQAALGLAEHGYQCFFVQDASGLAARRQITRRRSSALRMNNVQIVTTEMVMFEWLKRADVPEFRELLKIVKSV